MGTTIVSRCGGECEGEPHTWVPTLLPDGSWPGVGGGAGEQQVGEVMVGVGGSPTVFDVPTRLLAQVKATVYVFLSLTCRGEFPVIFFWGRGSFCLSNQSPPYIPHPHLPLASKAPEWLRGSEIRGHCP